jgi:hypothetical protein
VRSWDDYVKDLIFPCDGGASDACGQALIDISSLIRATPDRLKSSAADYVNRHYFHTARREVAGAGATI